MRLPRGARAPKGMGLTPLVDVIFLLLIFFVVATSFREPRIALELPEAEETRAAEEREVLRVEMRESGEILVDGEAMPAEGLDAAFASRAPAVDALELRADRNVTHGRVVEVLDRARANHLTEISIAVEAKRGSG